MTRSLGFEALLADGIVLAAEAQQHLAELHSDAAWNLDLDAGVLHFLGPSPGSYPIQVLGSAAPPGSWLWAWANPRGFAPQALEAATATRELGVRHTIAELTTPELPFPAVPAGEEPGERLAQELAIAARVASGRWFHYRAPATNGTKVWLLLEGLKLPAPSVPRTVRAIGEGLFSVALHDHARAISSYATLRGLAWDGSTLTLPDGTLTLEFDQHGRVLRMTGAGTGTGTGTGSGTGQSTSGSRADPTGI